MSVHKQENKETVTNTNSKGGRTMSNTEVYIVAGIFYAFMTGIVMDAMRKRDSDTLLVIGTLWVLISCLLGYQVFFK